MDRTPGSAAPAEPPDLGTTKPSAPTRKRSISGTGGLLSKLPFVRSSADYSGRPRARRSTEDIEVIKSPSNALPIPSFRTIPAVDPNAPPPLSHSILQQTQQKTRRRRGSLRKVALLGRGAQRERREDRALTIDTKFLPDRTVTKPAANVTSSPSPLDGRSGRLADDNLGTLGLGISDTTPRPSMDGFARSPEATPTEASPPTARPLTTPTTSTMRSPQDLTTDATLTSPSINYSTTDDEDSLHMAGLPSRPTTASVSLSSSSISLLRPERASLSSGSESYFPSAHGSRPLGPSTVTSIQHRRNTIQRAKSPLALTSLAAPLAPPEGDWDYSETEKWGWIILIVTWVVFVVGMGSCFEVWSWAWDVGTTPYAPPEFEDDPTLPIVGYYPVLIVLTAVMAWVWVVAAWVGMKYFRHARVSGD